MAGTKPNDLPDMIVGETRLVEFTWAGGAGINTLTGVTFSSIPTTGITFSTVEPDGLQITPFITAEQSGRFKILAEGVLTSGETIILPAYVNVRDPNACNRDSDYE